MRKKLYRDGGRILRDHTRIYILGPKQLEFSSNLSAIYTKWCAQTCPPIFGLFAIFDRNFTKSVAPSSEENENCVVHLKEKSNPF